MYVVQISCQSFTTGSDSFIKLSQKVQLTGNVHLEMFVPHGHAQNVRIQAGNTSQDVTCLKGREIMYFLTFVHFDHSLTLKELIFRLGV